MKIKKIIIALSFMMCVIVAMSCVAAADANDTAISESQSDDVIGAADGGSFLELEGKVLRASDGATITLDKDYSFRDNSNITTGVIIYKNLTIDGRGHTLDGKSKSRIFTTFYGSEGNNNVVLKNIVFKNGFSSFYGGAVINFVNLTVDNCTFKDNNAKIAGGAICSVGSLNLKNSRFDNNVAGGDAGAVFTLNLKAGTDLYRASNVTSSSFASLPFLTSIGMNFTLTHGMDYISKCVFSGNVAKGNGGGAVYAFSHMDIRDSTFTSNKADEKGAAVFGNKNLFIKDSVFKKNSVGMYGGAVYFKCHEHSGHYENGSWVSSIVYYSNLIEGSLFADNVADERGGAIYGFRTNSSDKVHCAKAVKCTFSDNKSPNGKDIYGGTLKKCTYKNTKITLKSVKIKKSAKKLVLSATLKKGTSPLKSKKVVFKFNGKTYKARTNSKGIAKYTIKKSVLKKLKVGKKVTYKAGYGSFIVKKTAKVKK